MQDQQPLPLSAFRRKCGTINYLGHMKLQTIKANQIYLLDCTYQH